MSQGSPIQDRTRENPALERYSELLAEYQVFEERLNTALAHKDRFSERVLQKVTGEYRSQMERISAELSSLEGQLRGELREFENRLGELAPLREEFQEGLEELELRTITGEVSEEDAQRRRAELEDLLPVSLESIEILERNVSFYADVLAGSAPVEVTEEDKTELEAGYEAFPSQPSASGATVVEPELDAPPVEEQASRPAPSEDEELGQVQRPLEESDAERAGGLEEFSELGDGGDALWMEGPEALAMDVEAAAAGAPSSRTSSDGADLAVEEDVEIPDELLIDEDEGYLETDLEEAEESLLNGSDDLLEMDDLVEHFEDEEARPAFSDPSVEQRAVVVLHEGLPDERTFPVQNRQLTVGRGPDNDIQLATDTAVSRYHSRISYEDGEYWISDLGSSNGTIVNGERIAKTVLTGDDEISIGQTVLRFKFES